MEEIFIPASGMAAEDVLVAEWLKEPGDPIIAGEPIAVVENDKATMELSSTVAGRLSRHLVNVGERVPGGTTVAYVLGEGESEPGGPNGGAPTLSASGSGTTTAAVQTSQSGESSPSVPSAPAGRQPDGRHAMSPRQRREMAATSAAGGSSPSPAVGPPVAAETVQSRNREATASFVTESWRTIPHFSVGRDIRADGLLEAVAACKKAGAAVTVTDYLVLALANALGSVGEPHDVGLAVATGSGVLIPVLRSLRGRSIPEVAALRKAAVDRAQARKLDPGDAAPVFATLSNLGAGGVTWFTGVVPVDQVALLTVGEVSLRPAVEGRGLIVAPGFTAVVTADHRRYDGVDSAKLLAAFVGQLSQLITEVTE